MKNTKRKSYYLSQSIEMGEGNIISDPEENLYNNPDVNENLDFCGDGIVTLKKRNYPKKAEKHTFREKMKENGVEYE